MRPAQPLYDVLPAPSTGPKDFGLAASSGKVALTPGRSRSATITVMPKGGFAATVNLAASGLPAGVTASFSPSSTGGMSTLTFASTQSTSPAAATVTITGVSGGLSHSVPISLEVDTVRTGTVQVDLTSAYNVTGIHSDDSTFAASTSLDGGGFACSERVLGATQEWDRVLFRLGPPNAPDAVASATVMLPAGKFSSLKILATGVQGSQESQTFSVAYADGTSARFTQSISDWYSPENFSGESAAVDMPYRLTDDGDKDSRPFHIYGYSFPLDSSRTVRSIALPANANVPVFAMTLVP